ncbi:uncharacterized protein LOC126735794 [Anthonomus grandis grandis]|uniref:uncharacterized protein LOC126735794 n=1 Tax=Anthonomus grandis grandis TaxID=2921223 RepID=UPI0021662C5D|nr:uncharacterized protein LOC126735794 [Anthonomus grandis grandis]
MDVNYLGGEELKYELHIRGLPLTGSFAQKRTSLRESLRLEREKHIDPPSSTAFDTDSELCLCRSKLISIERDIKTLGKDYCDGESKRINTLLLHLYQRINRVHAVSEVESVLKNEIVSSCTKLFGDLNLASQGIMPSCSYANKPPAITVTGATPSHEPHESLNTGDNLVVSNDLIVLSDEESTPVEELEAERVNSNVAAASTSQCEVAEQSIHLNNFQSGTSTSFAHSAINRELPQIESHSDAVPYGTTSNPSLTQQSRPPLQDLLELAQSSCPYFNPQQRTSSSSESRPSYGRFMQRDGSRVFQSSGNELNAKSSISSNPISQPPVSQINCYPVSSANESQSMSRQSQVRFGPPVVHASPPANSTAHGDNLSQSIPINDLVRHLEEVNFSPTDTSNRTYGREPRQLSHPSYHTNDVFRWNIKFNGQTSVNDFLERVEEIRLSRGVLKEQLLRSAPELFTGDALLWYRTNKFASWDDLVTKLKDSFRPYDYEYGLWDEIRRRTQGSQERVLTFIVAMESLFRKLSESPSESVKLNLIRRNLLPYIQSRLATHEIHDLHELTRLSRAIEETEARVQRFVPPPTNIRQLLEPELAYRKPSHHVASIESYSEPSDVKPIIPNNHSAFSTSIDAVSSVVTCWNCGDSGHRFRKCSKPKTFFCFRCGKRDVSAKTCPTCSKKRGIGKSIGRPSCLSFESQSAISLSKHVRTSAVLDFVLAHAKGDERPYLHIDIFGKSLLGLLDSGASRTIIGSAGWSVLSTYCTLKQSGATECTVANGQQCSIKGIVTLPMRLRTRVVLMDVLVVPSLPHSLILGIDFWTRMGIIPDLNTGEWHFKDVAPYYCHETAAIQSVDTLTPTQKGTLDRLIEDVFSNMSSTLGCTNLVKLEIRTNSAPIKQRYYPLSRALQKDVNTELEQMIANGIVEPSISPWSSPIVMVKKKTGEWRFCVDYRALNRVTIKDSYPIPFVSATLDKLRDAKFLSTLDIKSAYWQIPIAPESRPLTAFTVPTRGLFQFTRMPFGLTNAPAVWQRLIDSVIGVDLEPYVFVYLDDVIISTPSFEEHIRVLREVIQRIVKAGLTLNREKCTFCKPELKYLGYIVNSSGLLVDPDKIEAILRIPTPKTVTDIRRIVGLTSWYRRFVPNFSTIVSPLTSLTMKNVKFVWSPECENAFNTIKEKLVSAPVLSCPDFDLPFIIQCDASDFGLGAVLYQVQGDEEHAICFLSRSLTKNERRYSTTEKECLAVIFAIEKLRPYVEGSHFTVVTDHYSLKWLNSIKDPVGRIARWAVRLQQYDFDIVHRKGKDNIVPDALSRSVPVVDEVAPLNDMSTNDSSFLIDKWYSSMLKRVKEQPSKYPLWWISNNKLYKRTKSKYPALDNPDDAWLQIVPRNQRSDVIKAHHDPPTCGHLGVFKTLSRISQKYYWPNMKCDVARYIARCHTCLRTKPLQKVSSGHLLSPQPTLTRPWQILSVDLVGPLPRSRSGYSFVLSVYDLFSKYPLFFPLRVATASSILKWLEDHVLLVYGIPDRIIADNGPQFRSGAFQNKMQEYGIQIRYTANYHPQANPVERVHRVLKTIISSYVDEDHRTWDLILAKAGCAIRSARHEVTGLTPNFVIFGRELRFLCPTPTLISPSNPNDSDPTLRSKTLEKVFVDVQKRLKRACEQRSRRYNLRHRDERFQLGQEVWQRNYVISNAAKNFTSKFAPKYLGPYKISKILSPWSYEVSDLTGRCRGVWHAKDLKAHPPDNNVQDQI